MARTWDQKDKGIHATVGRERQGHSYYDYDYRYHYYDYDYRYHYYDSDYYYYESGSVRQRKKNDSNGRF